MKILFVGLGGAGQRHLRILSELLGDKAEYIAYRARGRSPVITKSFKLDESQTVEERYGITSYNNLDEAVSQKPDVAIISNPTSEHVKVALPLARAGCSLFVEKPLSHLMDNVPELIDTAKKNSPVAYVGYMMRFHPCIRFMHKTLKEDKLGKILSSQLEVASFMPSWHLYEDYRQLYAARKDLGGGVVLTESHEFDYLYWFFGMPKRVFAVGGKLSSYEMDVEDTADILLDYGFPVNLHMCFVQQPPSRLCQINGTKGALRWDGSNKIGLYDASKKEWEYRTFEDFEREDMFVSQLKHFLACLEGKEKPLISLDDGMNSLRIALSAKKSMESGGQVVME